ncbi:PIN domain-containing protein [Candidatus Woesearchaeota archaeon]|nr:PIN domain-containing protein [Candidatus Woesearchaeota archaeon]
MYLLDTSALIELSYGTELAYKIKELIGQEYTVITTISIEEFLVGIDETKFDIALSVFGAFHVYALDIESAIESAKIERELKKNGKIIQRSNIFIAGICKRHNLELITCDEDFLRITSLRVRVIK